jgi:RNA polymerase-binding transcription factor DksA
MPQQLPEVRERLLARLDEIDAQLAELRDELVEATDSQLDEGTLANHPADEASDMLLAETDLGQIREIIAEQRDIAEAFQRMEAGVYGICVDCGHEIAHERLVILPLARRCLPCQLALERAPQPRQPEQRPLGGWSTPWHST